MPIKEDPSDSDDNSNLRRFKTFIRSRDIFGHFVSFNFNQEGYYHKTFGGGVMSIIVKTLLVIYIYSLFEKMIKFDDDRIYTQVIVE